MNPTSDAAFKADLFRDDDLGSVIRVHLHMEHHVNEILELLVPLPENLKPIKLDYDGKVNLLCALGADRESTKVLKALGSMRNKFAHNLNFKLDKSNVINLYEALSFNAKEVLQASHNNARSKEEHQGIVVFKKLPFKGQFIIIAVVIRKMVLELKAQYETSV